MTIYVLYYLFIILLSFLMQRVTFTRQKTVYSNSLAGSTNGKDIWLGNRRKSFVLVSFIALIFLVGMRHPTMGIDLKGYLPAFDLLAQRSWRDAFTVGYQNYDRGYIVLNKVAGVVWANRQFLLLVCAMLSLIPIGMMIYRYSKEPLLSIIIYLGLPIFPFVFSGLRQAIAIGIGAISYSFVIKRRFIPFCVTVALACLFHYSAFVLILVYPAFHIRFSRKTAVVSAFFLPVIWLLKSPIFSVVSKLLKKSPKIDNNGAFTLFFVFFCIYAFCVLIGNRKNPKTNGLSNVFWIACAIQAMAGMHSTALRVGYYFILSLPLLLPEVLQDIKNNDNYPFKLAFRIAIYVCFIIYGYYSIKHTSWAMCYPYHFFWHT